MNSTINSILEFLKSIFAPTCNALLWLPTYRIVNLTTKNHQTLINYSRKFDLNLEIEFMAFIDCFLMITAVGAAQILSLNMWETEGIIYSSKTSF